ncbi:response regulator [Polaribacter reichenbachii]|nr:response regulator [Polaribacter reichenbachii]
MKYKYNVMLIDDDFSTSRFHQIILERLNTTENIIFKRNGQDALDYFKREGIYAESEEGLIDPDIVLVDLNMPVMNGFRFIELFTKTEIFKNKSPKIIVLSTSLIPEEKEKIEANNDIYLFLNKPLTKEKVTELMSDI